MQDTFEVTIRFNSEGQFDAVLDKDGKEKKPLDPNQEPDVNFKDLKWSALVVGYSKKEDKGHEGSCSPLCARYIMGHWYCMQC
jgi:hypothetical protein